MQRGLKFLFEIICALDPSRGIDSSDGRRVLSDDHLDATAPNVSTRAQMGKHVICGPLIAIGGGYAIELVPDRQ